MNFSKINELKHYDLNCNIFDVYSYEGLSIQELLCQFYTKINECVDFSNSTLDLCEWLVNEGLKQEVAVKLTNWLNDGTLENLINVRLFKNLNNKIDYNMDYLDVKKLDKNGIVTMSNMGQDVKEAMTGGSVAVVGENTILTENIVDKQVTPSKISFLKNENINVINLDNAKYSGNGISISIKDNVITINGTSTAQTWLKLTNNQALALNSGDYSEWVNEVCNDFNVGEIYSALTYEISGTVSTSSNKATTLSVRDINRVSMINSSSNITSIINKQVAFVQLFIEEGIVFDNYQLLCYITPGPNLPSSHKDAMSYRLSDLIKIPKSVENKICEIDDIVMKRESLLSALHKQGIEIDYSYITNKLYSNTYSRFEVDGLTITIDNGLITINGTSNNYVYIKLTNGYDVSYGDLGGNKKDKWIRESVTDILTMDNRYKTSINIVGGNVTFTEQGDSIENILISARDKNYTSCLKGSKDKLVNPSSNDIKYIQLYLPRNATYNNLQLYPALYENVIPPDFIINKGVNAELILPNLDNSDYSWRYQGNSSTIKEYPTMLKAKQVLEIQGTYFNAIQGGCTDGKYLYCGVVNQRDDSGNTTVHKIDIKNWEIVKTVTEYSLGHCNSMTYCDYDGYIHCIGLEEYNDYKVVHRITTDLEYVDSYTIDLSPYYEESTGIGAIDYNPNTEQFVFLIRGNKKGYAFYTKHRTFIKIVWTEKLNGTYAGMSTDNNFIYQSVWNGGDINNIAIFDYEGNTLRNINVLDMIGEIEEAFIYKDKMISVANSHSYDNLLVYEISLNNFILV